MTFLMDVKNIINCLDYSYFLYLLRTRGLKKLLTTPAQFHAVGCCSYIGLSMIFYSPNLPR